MEFPLVRMTIGYVVERDHLIMIHRNMNPDDIHYKMWIAPGGSLEGLELPDDCLRREFLEETGLSLEDFYRIGVIHFDNTEHIRPNGKQFGFNAEVFLYGINRTSGTMKLHDDKSNPIYRVPIQHVYTKPMHEGDRFLWAAIQQNWGKQFDAYIKHIGDKLDKKHSRIQFH